MAINNSNSSIYDEFNEELNKSINCQIINTETFIKDDFNSDIVAALKDHLEKHNLNSDYNGFIQTQINEQEKNIDPYFIIILSLTSKNGNEIPKELIKELNIDKLNDQKRIIENHHDSIKNIDYKVLIKDIFTFNNKYKNDIVNLVIKEMKSNISDFIFIFNKLCYIFTGLNSNFEVIKSNDEYFLLINLYCPLEKDEEFFIYLAQKFNYSLQLQFQQLDKSNNLTGEELSRRKNDYYKSLDTYDNNCPEFYPPFFEYVNTSYQKYMNYDEKDESDFEKDNTGESKISIFRNIDRERLILMQIRENLNIFKNETKIKQLQYTLIHSQTIKKFYNYEDVFSQENIINSFKFLIKSEKSSILNRKYRNFYGEQLGLYFSWISHYINWLLLPISMFLVYFIIYLLLISTFSSFSYISELLFYTKCILSLCLMFWGNFYTQSWRNQNKFLKYSWGILQDSEFEERHIRGDIETFQYANIKYMQTSVSDDIVRKLLVILLTIVLIIIQTSVYFLIFYIENLYVFEDELSQLDSISLRKAVNKEWVYISPILAFFIRELNTFLFSYFPKIIMRIDAYDSSKKYFTSLILNTYAFQFFNHYFIFFYVAFIKDYYNACTYGDCYDELNIYVTMMLIMTILGNLFDISLMMFHHSKNYEKKFKDLSLKYSENNKEKVNDNKIHNLLKENNDGESLIFEYLSILMSFGYIILFGSVSPMCFFLSLIQAILERYYNAIKYGKYVNITINKEISGKQEIFVRIMKIQTVFGFTSSVLINLFTNKEYFDINDTIKWLVALFFVTFSVYFLYFIKIDMMPYWFKYVNEFRKKLYSENIKVDVKIIKSNKINKKK